MDGDFHKGLMLRWQTKLTGSLENPNANDTSKISSIPAAVNFKGKSSGKFCDQYVCLSMEMKCNGMNIFRKKNTTTE